MVQNIEIFSRIERTYASNLMDLSYKFDEKLKASNKESVKIEL